MRTLAVVTVALTACLGVVPACVAAPPQIVLTDPGYPLWEMRPLDRRVYVLTLDGDWKIPADPDALYDINIEYPGGGAATHRPPLEASFRLGEVQCLLIQYQWEKNHFRPGDNLTVFITRRKPGGAPGDAEVVSNRLNVASPFDRRVVRLPPKTRFSEPEPIDDFPPLPPEPAAPPKAGPALVPLPPPTAAPLPPPRPGPAPLPPPLPDK